jgi:HPt (histidine-containing phosphotransfer) domain-containing protein
MTNENVKSIPPLVDTTVLDELQSIMDDEFIDILQLFLEESINLMSEIHAAFVEESDNLIRVVHTLKSCSKNVGAMRLGGIAGEIEKYLVNKDVATAKTNLDELQDVFTESHVLIKKYMQDHMHEIAY